VIAPAKTGRDRSNRRVVMKIDQTKSGMRSIVIPVLRMLITVVMKFTAPKMEDTPAKCSEKIARSTEAPA